ncbi:MAG: DUF1080 domain-containing protein [Thermoguttaceae bacterium]|jgi:hypothetical protein
MFSQPDRRFRCRFAAGLTCLGWVLFAAATAPGGPPAAGQEKKAAQGKELFDGKTLAGWKATQFGGEGKVLVKDGTIVLERGDSMTGITWSGKYPRTNYELTLEGMRVDGHDFFCTTTFPVGKEFCSLVVGGWGGTVMGLSCVDHFDASENPTTSFQQFEDKRWYALRIRVSDAKIEAWLDGKQVVNQQREGHKFGVRMECDLSCPLGVCTWYTKGAVRNIRLRELAAAELKPAETEEK